MDKKGLFITFEGIDGCGKSTQIRKFVEYLFNRDKHNHVILTRNPYKDANIRAILRDDDDPISQADKLASLFIGDRRLHAEEVVVPNIEKGNFVVSDRFKLSTVAYQGAQGISIEDLIRRQKDLPIPDITFVIDVDAREATNRMLKDGDREKGREHKFEASLEFLEKTRMNYHGAKELLDEKIFIINGMRDVDEIHKEIIKIFEENVVKKKRRVKYTSMDEVPEEIKQKLSRYFTNIGGDSFVIHGFLPELTGGALARYSRAPTGIQLTIINEFLDEEGNPSQEKGSELMDRVLNAFGDDSVGELEGCHVGIENISQLITKAVEDRRIGGSPIEQSTRYIKYDIKDEDGRWRYLRPKEIVNSSLFGMYERVNDHAFEVYSELIVKLQEYFMEKLPEDEFEIDVERDGEKVKAKKIELDDKSELRAFRNAYNFTIRCAALDVGRCVLPSSTLSHMGVYGNGRFFSNLLSTLKSGELSEEKDKGYELEVELKKIIPTFVKRNKESDRLKKTNERMRVVSSDLFSRIKPEDDHVTLVNRGEHVDEVIASSLFPYTNISYNQIIKIVEELDGDKKMEIMKNYVGHRGTRRDRTGRGFEAGYPITFDLVGCFAEYRDLQRHRMLTQQRQLLGTNLGFIMPSEVIEVGFESKVNEVVEGMEELNKKILDEGLLVVSQYATLFNHRMRFMMGMNLREFQHLVELRSQPAGHFSYRAMVMDMARELDKRDEWAASSHEFVDYSDPGNKISRANEQSRIAGKNLASGIEGDLDY